MHDRRLIITVTAAVVANANARAKEVDTDGGERAFVVGLSPTGQPPVTHYWCSWQMTGPVDAAIRNKLQNAVDAGHARVFNGNVRTPESVLAELGLQRVDQAA